jgi:hypothetical protein
MNIENSIFASIGEASIARPESKYYSDGVYLSEVTDVKMVDSTHPSSLGEKMIFIETTILDVLVDKGTWTNGRGDNVSTKQAGENISICIKMKWTKWDSYMKAFLCAAGKITTAQASEIPAHKWIEFAEKSCFHLGDTSQAFDVDEWTEQPLKGAQLKIIAQTVKTSQGHDFTKIAYEATE